MKLQTYRDMRVVAIDKTPISVQIHKFACDLTMKKADDISEKSASSKLYEHLINAEHTSILEHSSMTFLASGISRSLLAQVTRQRTFSFTSASQHYQDYRDYPMSIRPEAKPEVQKQYVYALTTALNQYIRLIELGELPEEARQVLPNACSVNLLITANPRALALFLRQRLCSRNTEEMITFALRLHKICKSWIPELFEHIGPPCVMDSKCNQGALTCKKS